MNTKNERYQKSQGLKSRPKQKPKARGASPHHPDGDRKLHEHERPETRMFR